MCTQFDFELEIATVSTDIVEKIFMQNISMGKGMGLMSMVCPVRDALGRTPKRRSEQADEGSRKRCNQEI